MQTELLLMLNCYILADCIIHIFTNLIDTMTVISKHCDPWHITALTTNYHNCHFQTAAGVFGLTVFDPLQQPNSTHYIN